MTTENSLDLSPILFIPSTRQNKTVLSCPRQWCEPNMRIIFKQMSMFLDNRSSKFRVISKILLNTVSSHLSKHLCSILHCFSDSGPSNILILRPLQNAPLMIMTMMMMIMVMMQFLTECCNCIASFAIPIRCCLSVVCQSYVVCL